MKIVAASTRGSTFWERDADLHELRGEALGLIRHGLVILILLLLGVAAVNARFRQPELVLVLLPILVAVGASQTRRISMPLAIVTVIIGLGLAIVAAVLIYQDRQILYWFALLVVVANVLLGDLLSFALAGLASSAIVILAGGIGDVTDGSTGAVEIGHVLLFVWITTALAWLAARPTRKALDWSWRSYLLALQRTRELQERQGELGRLSKSLNETCTRLEEMNEELERARQAADEARRLTAEFAMAISHELRTPLNLVLGFSEMLLRPSGAPEGSDLLSQLPDSYRRGLEVIYRNAEHISHLVNDVLDLGQIEVHRMALVKSWASPREIAEQACAIVAPLFDHLGLALVVDVPHDLPLLYVDPDRVRQILINLLNNAARFTDCGQVVVRGFCDERNVVLAVADTGAGIAPEDLPYVFRRFQQFGPKERRQGGCGLGLALCKQLAEMHGGDVRVESQLGQGSTFFVELPRCGNIISTPISKIATPRTVGARTIAVLDQEGETAQMFQRYLDGYRVVGVRNAHDLIQLARNHSLHALLVNEQSAPAGWQDTQELDPRLRSLPVFTCSLATTRSHADRLGVAEYLVKPVSREQLSTILRRHCRRVGDILIVEDDPEMASLLAEVVRGLSPRFRVQCVADGMQALMILRERRPRLVLLDLGVPSLRGSDLLREMKADPNLCRTTVVVITGESLPEEAVRTTVYSLRRAGGFTVGEMMRCLRANLDAVVPLAVPDTAPTRLARLSS